MPYFIFILTCIGISNIICTSQLFAPLRAMIGRIHPKLEYFVSCMMCLPWWVGLILSMMGYGSDFWFADACISSCLSYLYYVLTIFLCKEC